MAESKLLTAIINHVVLPPGLPQKQDDDLAEIQEKIGERLVDACRKLSKLTGSSPSESSKWEAVRVQLQRSLNLHSGNEMNKKLLLQAFRELDIGHYLILHIAQQNAGLIIYRQSRNDGDYVVFEAFEASVAAQAALNTRTALLRDFPDTAAEMPYSTFQEDAFQKELAENLSMASNESVKRFAPVSKKSKSSAYESRDTVDPILVTSWLLTVIEALGRKTQVHVSQKKDYDDVCWHQAEVPWRRSSFWLVFKVGLERSLRQKHGKEGRLRYKLILAIFTAKLLRDAIGNVSIQSLAFLDTKLCKRLAKLQAELNKSKGNQHRMLESFFESAGAWLRKSIVKCNEHTTDSFAMFQDRRRRSVPLLPRTAKPGDCKLQLAHSQRYIIDVLIVPPMTRQDTNMNLARAVMIEKHKFVINQRELAMSEGKLATWVLTPDRLDAQSSIVMTAKRIRQYLENVGDCYYHSPPQLSAMLLLLMELWVRLDRAAVKLYPLLKDFAPGFPPASLDSLQVSQDFDVVRLRAVQSYIELRLRECKSSKKTVFVLGHDSFAERFYQTSAPMQELFTAIVQQANADEAAKEAEWVKKGARYRHLQLQYEELPHQNFRTGKPIAPSTQDHKECKKCFCKREKKRLKIKIFEWPLPDDAAMAHAMIFELRLPVAFKEYRDITARILRKFMFPEPKAEQKGGATCHITVNSYFSQYHNRSGQRQDGSVTLGSSSKSLFQQHYSEVNFPVEMSKVSLPNNLKLHYVDSSQKVWWLPGPALRPSFAPLLMPLISEGSAFETLLSCKVFTDDGHDLSSNQILASLVRCPPDVSQHEWQAMQQLLSGCERRWPQILEALASSTLNFGSQAVLALVSQIVLQTGPDDGRNTIGTAHKPLRDPRFRERLCDELYLRLNSLSSNWRETQAMRLLITIADRLCGIPDSTGSTHDGFQLLRALRKTLRTWVLILRQEFRTTVDKEAANRYSSYALESALLCKKTFSAFRRSEYKSLAFFEPFDAQCYIESSITIGEHLTHKPSELPVQKLNDVREDATLAFHLHDLFRDSLCNQCASIYEAFISLWPDLGGSGATYGKPYFRGPNDDWIELRVERTRMYGEIATRYSQLFAYHLPTGLVSVNNKSIGKLPDEFSTLPLLEELFGLHSFEITQSELPGMTYLLQLAAADYQIHLGFRGANRIVRMCRPNQMLELIPRDVFGPADSGDLPAPLIKDCVHWLDLNTGMIECHRKPDIFISNKAHWTINFPERTVSRADVKLVETTSRAHRHVSRIFGGFEKPWQLLVYQPDASRGRIENLRVELPQIELTFRVNGDSLLECEQLHAEIPVQQDIGTWYGLASGIVLRDIRNPQQRSVLIPMGGLHWQIDGCHVKVTLEQFGPYGRFTVNEILGRIECPPEPSLIYTKALLHALTSFVIPDSLTGRTGTEEALACLQSGAAQPWTPLRDYADTRLRALAALSPRRTYYPIHLKTQEETIWHEDLPQWIQHDGLRMVVNQIRTKSNALVPFTPGSQLLPDLKAGDRFLELRALCRRGRFGRHSSISEIGLSSDTVYQGRYQAKQNSLLNNSYEITRLIADWQLGFPVSDQLSILLESWESVTGWLGQDEPALLSDRFTCEIKEHWGALLNACRQASVNDKYHLIFLLSSLAFRHDAEMGIIRFLVALAMSDDLKRLAIPSGSLSMPLQPGLVPQEAELMDVVRGCLILDPAQNSGPYYSKKARRSQEQRNNEACEQFMQVLLPQWPNAINETAFEPSGVLQVPAAIEAIKPSWDRLRTNELLMQYVRAAQSILDEQKVTQRLPRPIPLKFEGTTGYSSHHHEICYSLNDLLRMDRFDLSIPELIGMQSLALVDSPKSIRGGKSEVQLHKPEASELENLVLQLSSSSSSARAEYGADLLQSIQAMKASRSYRIEEATYDELVTEAQVNATHDRTITLLQEIQAQIARIMPESTWLQLGNLWPDVSLTSLLQELRASSRAKLSAKAQKVLIRLGLAVHAEQRVCRIRDAELRGAHLRAGQERSDPGHTNWAPENYPDWLLIEIDGNITIREVQVDVALATITPSSHANSCLQLNMGGGKSSVILPMCAAVLADTKRLMRVVVPKSLLLQSAQVLQSKLGGLLDREILHIPFSRRTPADLPLLKCFEKIHSDMLHSGGVMICLPEHLLSFKLSGQQRLVDDKLEVGREMIKIQNWFSHVGRDVIDECDEILSTKQQLVFPSGSQLAVDCHPHRWILVQDLLDLAARHAISLKETMPGAIDFIQKSTGRFPVIYFLRPAAELKLAELLVEDVCEGRLRSLPIDKSLPANAIHAVHTFLSEAHVSKKLSVTIASLFPENPAARSMIYLLRGLLVHGLLVMTLKRRWNVQYGLHPERDPISVPFHAKGNPSDTAEWGHPDVSLLFTTLSFFYGGLNKQQLKQALDHVLKSDDPKSEYEQWLRWCFSVPPSLQIWSSINTSDASQLDELWQHLSTSQSAILFYLNRFVFPVHAKQFANKLQASGWDLAQFCETAQSAASGLALTTGFSGTNDQKWLLPLPIKQNDLIELSRTNAEVLASLLEERNRGYIHVRNEQGARLSEFGLLSLLKEEKIRILIDAGASIVETTNLDLASQWLKICPDAPAAVYFNREGKALVLYRGGDKVPLIASPYVGDLSNLLVFIDHQHVRGVDLKFPADARGAVTLTLGQTKDTTIQAAKRLRQLETTQSVTWLAPPEVNQSILDCREPTRSGPLTSRDVVWWLLEQTCRHIEQNYPLYTVQGENFCKQVQARKDHPDFLKDASSRMKYIGSLQQVERQTLEELYDPYSQQRSCLLPKNFAKPLQPFVAELSRLRSNHQSSSTFQAGTLEEVEQEREVTSEAEVVRQIQRPEDFRPLQYAGLHPDVVNFIQSGLLPGSRRAGCASLFEFLSQTVLGAKHAIAADAQGVPVFVTNEFSKTIKTHHRSRLDNFIRPVNWVLFSPAKQQALLVSPEEAETILSRLSTFQAIHAYLVLYSAPTTRKMRAFEGLNYYSLPSMPYEWQARPLLKALVGLVAGALYFDYKTYEVLRDFLSECGSGKESMGIVTGNGRLIQKPLAFFKSWLDIRRRGHDFYETPAGHLSQSRDLDPDHRFFRV